MKKKEVDPIKKDTIIQNINTLYTIIFITAALALTATTSPQTPPTAYLEHWLTRQAPICGCLGSVPIEIHEELSRQQGQGSSALNIIACHVAEDIPLSELPFSRGGPLEPEFGEEMKKLISCLPFSLDVQSMGVRNNTHEQGKEGH